ncbi:MAG: NfeD family protein [Alteromonadaceae bacterium]|nr:NfeD family protein [Alteromonadaceae bacterium]
MDFLLLLETWLIIAVIFSLAEIFVPGGILLNLGIASIIVAVGVHQQYLDTWVLTLTTWFISASILLFIAYLITERFLSSDQRIDNVYEEVDIYGKDVLVTEKIGPGNQTGRVEFQGTTWTALSDGSEIPAGNHASIVCKENISLLVEKTV